MTIPNDANQYLPPVIQIPSALEISSITQANPMVVTASGNTDQVNTYIPGQLVRFLIPYSYGMFQLANKTLAITAVSGNNFTFGIDSTFFDPFVIPPSTAETPASFASAGSRNLALDNTTRQVPFQSLNNRGN